MQDGTGNTTYTYDALDRKLGVRIQNSLRTTYSYDAVGRRSKTLAPIAAAGTSTPVTYSYDGAGRRTSVFNSGGNAAFFSYDANDRRVNDRTGSGIVVTTTVYDAADRVIGLSSTVPNDNLTITNYTYRYDNTTNRVGATEVDGSLVTWSYDNTYQLIGEQRTDAGGSTTLTYNTTYTYDAVGNRLVKWDSGALTTSTYDVANQLQTSVSSAGVTTYTFDLTGNQQIVATPSGITTTTWDNENRQTHVTRPAGAANSFSYNADGQRYLAQNSSGKTLFVWDGQALLGLGGVSSGNPTSVNYLVMQEPETFGGLISVISTFTGTPVYYIFDALGSMVNQWQGSGLSGTAAYKAFGEILKSSGATYSDIGSPFLWNAKYGYWYDADLGSYHAGEREMLALIGRWTKKDPTGLGPDINPFRVVGNNVVVLNDPAGLFVDSLTCACPRGASSVGFFLVIPLGSRCTPAAVAVNKPIARQQCCNSPATCWGLSGILVGNCAKGKFSVLSWVDDCLVFPDLSPIG